MIDKWRKASLGAFPFLDGQIQFLVWAPKAKSVHIKFDNNDNLCFPMEAKSEGYFYFESNSTQAQIDSFYSFSLDDHSTFYPDPASRHQPRGVHGPSQIVDPHFSWSDQKWQGLKTDELVIYELHVGTFSKERTFLGLIPYLEELKELGITAIEIMPVAQFPGERNWGYDGVFPFAVQNSYGGPLGFKKFVDACHLAGLGVILDVVYNHLGPEGNYLSIYGHYFQDRYKTPWGEALNFDGPYSDHVRRFFIQNAMQWLDEFHVDGLRLDAVHAICDMSAIPFLEELALAKSSLEQKSSRSYLLIAESAANDSRILAPSLQGGMQMDAQWCDDFHHSLHAYLTEEKSGYYQDYGELSHVAKALKDGMVYQGEFSAFRHHRHGRSYHQIDPKKLVVFCQNHDQVGNRCFGERLSQLVDFDKLKLAASCLLLSPFTPLLFMGEEYGEMNPFLYFIDHGDPKLVEAVKEGRKKEFDIANEFSIPNPASLNTFLGSSLNHEAKKTTMRAKVLLEYHKQLISLSKWIRQSKIFAHMSCQSDSNNRVIWIESRTAGRKLYCFFSFLSQKQKCPIEENLKGRVLVRSSDFLEDRIRQQLNQSNNLVSSRSLELLPYESVAFLAEKDT